MDGMAWQGLERSIVPLLRGCVFVVEWSKFVSYRSDEDVMFYNQSQGTTELDFYHVLLLGIDVVMIVAPLAKRGKSCKRPALMTGSPSFEGKLEYRPCTHSSESEMLLQS